jgi:hypothetical protein
LRRSSQFFSEFPCPFPPNPLFCWDEVRYNFDQDCGM